MVVWLVFGREVRPAIGCTPPAPPTPPFTLTLGGGVAGGGVDAAEELVDDLVDGEGGAGAGRGLRGIGSLDCIRLEAVGEVVE
jgi:hypothetical protein